MILLHSRPFEERLSEQTEMLRTLTTSYDRGQILIVKLMATIAATMVEILNDAEGGQFIRARGLKFPTTIDPHGLSRLISPLERTIHHVDDNLQIVDVSSIPVFMANPFPREHWIGFGKWKAQKVHWSDQNTGLSRERFILEMRNADGGAHPYRKPGDGYESLATGQGVMTIRMNGAPDPYPPIHFSAMRQIGYELLLALTTLRSG